MTAYNIIYDQLMTGRDALERARIDALIGMPDAKAKHQALLIETLESAGVEVR